MMDFLFFIKTFVLTIAVVLFMQIEIGSKSIESHAMGWVQSSAVVAPLHEVARGGSRVVQDFIRKVSSSVQKNVFKTKHQEPRHQSDEAQD